MTTLATKPCTNIPKYSDEENWDVNGAMLEDFLDALDITGASKKLRCFILMTGAKRYGIHLGYPKYPMEESDPWIEGEGRRPNFYYHQQRILHDAPKKRTWDWVVTCPNDLIVVATGKSKNLATSLALYPAIFKEIDGNLIFPGSETFPYSRLHAAFNLWAALEPKGANPAFNVINGDVEPWHNMWPKVAKRFSCQIPRNQFKVDRGKHADTVMKIAEKAPLAEVAAQVRLEGNLRQNQVEQKIELIKWSRRDDVQKAWQKLEK